MSNTLRLRLGPLAVCSLYDRFHGTLARTAVTRLPLNVIVRLRNVIGPAPGLPFRWDYAKMREIFSCAVPDEPKAKAAAHELQDLDRRVRLSCNHKPSTEKNMRLQIPLNTTDIGQATTVFARIHPEVRPIMYRKSGRMPLWLVEAPESADFTGLSTYPADYRPEPRRSLVRRAAAALWRHRPAWSWRPRLTTWACVAALALPPEVTMAGIKMAREGIARLWGMLV